MWLHSTSATSTCFLLWHLLCLLLTKQPRLRRLMAWKPEDLNPHPLQRMLLHPHSFRRWPWRAIRAVWASGAQANSIGRRMSGWIALRARSFTSEPCMKFSPWVSATLLSWKASVTSCMWLAASTKCVALVLVRCALRVCWRRTMIRWCLRPAPLSHTFLLPSYLKRWQKSAEHPCCFVGCPHVYVWNSTRQLPFIPACTPQSCPLAWFWYIFFHCFSLSCNIVLLTLVCCELLYVWVWMLKVLYFPHTHCFCVVHMLVHALAAAVLSFISARLCFASIVMARFDWADATFEDPSLLVPGLPRLELPPLEVSDDMAMEPGLRRGPPHGLSAELVWGLYSVWRARWGHHIGLSEPVLQSLTLFGGASFGFLLFMQRHLEHTIPPDCPGRGGYGIWCLAGPFRDLPRHRRCCVTPSKMLARWAVSMLLWTRTCCTVAFPQHAWLCVLSLLQLFPFLEPAATFPHPLAMARAGPMPSVPTGEQIDDFFQKLEADVQFPEAALAALTPPPLLEHWKTVGATQSCGVAVGHAVLQMLDSSLWPAFPCILWLGLSLFTLALATRRTYCACTTNVLHGVEQRANEHRATLRTCASRPCPDLLGKPPWKPTSKSCMTFPFG